MNHIQSEFFFNAILNKKNTQFMIYFLYITPTITKYAEIAPQNQDETIFPWLMSVYFANLAHSVRRYAHENDQHFI